MQLLLAILLCHLAAAESKLSLGDKGVANVQLLETNEQAKIKIELPDGSRQVIAVPGEHWQFVQGEGESKRLVVKDFDGNGREDFVVRVSAPPGASQVYAYHYDAQLGKFIPFLFADDDYLVAEINGLVEVLPQGIAIEDEEWPGEEAPAGTLVHARKVWRFSGKRFLPF